MGNSPNASKQSNHHHNADFADYIATFNATWNPQQTSVYHSYHKHFGAVNAIDCARFNSERSNRNNLLIASVSRDSKILIWMLDVKTSKKGKIKKCEIKKLSAINVRSARCVSCALSSDAQFLAYGAAQSTLTVHRRNGSNNVSFDAYLSLNIRNDSTRINCIRFIAYKSVHFIVAASGNRRIYLVNVDGKSKEETRARYIAQTHHGLNAVLSVKFDVTCIDGERYFIAYNLGKRGVHVMDITDKLHALYSNNECVEYAANAIVQTGQVLHDVSSEQLLCIAFSPNAMFLCLAFQHFEYSLYFREEPSGLYRCLCQQRSSESLVDGQITSVKWLDTSTCVIAQDVDDSVYMVHITPFSVNRTYKKSVIDGIACMFRRITSDSIESLAVDFAQLVLSYMQLYEATGFTHAYFDLFEGDETGHGCLTSCPDTIVSERASVLITAGLSGELHAIIPNQSN